MKKLILTVLLVLSFFGCERYVYDDTAIWEQLEKMGQLGNQTDNDALEILCNQLNANMSSLQTVISARQANDLVTNIISMMDNGKEVGYLITLAEKGSVPVYLNLDADQYWIPDLDLKKDRDGIYYWSMYSAWLLDKEGNKVSAPPCLKIESGYWYISLDNGAEWEQLESVSAVDGWQKEEEPCFMFRSLEFKGKDSIVLTIENGEVITLPMWSGYDPWDGYLDPDVYEEQDIINLTNVLMANMNNCNLATRHIMDIAYNFWKRRGEFIYCSHTALDRPWDYWSYVGFKDGNTGFLVGEGHGGYKRIDCSTFVRYVMNGIDYYSTPYYNALEWTEVVQGALSSKGANASSNDKTVCRSGKIYLRHGRKHLLESSSSSKYRFTKVFAYDRSGKVVKTLTGNTEFVMPEGSEYIRVEMKVQSADNYTPAVKGESPAAILRCLRIRENERLEVNAGCPVENRRAHTMSRWFDENGHGLVAYDDYNPLCWDDADFEPGTVVFMGKNSATSEYKGITHVTMYIGGGYIIHSQAPRGLLGGEGIMIDRLRDMELRYDRPFCAAASPEYHSNYDEEKSNL